jgi:hypothetical protein
MNVIKHSEKNIEAHYEYKGNGGYLFPVVEIICKNHSMEFVRMKTESGSIILKKQCFECGEVSGSQFKKDLVRNFEELPFIDVLLRSCKDDFNSDVRRHLKVIENENAWQEYAKYLNSDLWKRKRDAVFKRDNYTCKACETNKATEVHHLNYENIYDEPLFDLISVCKRCHDKIELKKQEKRGF